MSNGDKEISITQYSSGGTSGKIDHVAIEEPLEIRVVSGPETKRRGKSLSITMRTPGHDEELALGFLFTEGILTSIAQVVRVEYCGPLAEGQKQKNTIRIELSNDAEFDPQKLQRHFYTTSSCGVCGKASLEALYQQSFAPVTSQLQISASKVSELPSRLRCQQESFQRTGGIHAAGMFDREGNLMELREDVGRHNALDKLIGTSFRNGELPASERMLVVSGRASFELLQKSLAAGFPVFVAVGAPSSLAVELATEFGITLIGFASESKFNVYCHAHRIRGER